MIINNANVTEKVKTICELFGKKRAENHFTNSLNFKNANNQLIELKVALITSILKSFIWEAKINVDVDSINLYEAKYRIANLKKSIVKLTAK